MHGRSADTSLAEIHQKMSELFDKQVNTQREKLPGFTQVPGSPQKVCNENETKKVEEKNNTRVKLLLMEGSPL